MNNPPLYKVLFALGFLIIITLTPFLIIYEIDTLKFFQYIYTLTSIEGVITTAFSIRVKLCLVSFAVKIIKPA